MRLEVVTPSAHCLDIEARRILAEAPGGHFGILPGHADFVSQLVPGILVCETAEGDERFVAVAAGTLVKCGDVVRVAVRAASQGDDLARLQATVDREFRAHDEEDKAARAALARLEAGMIRRFRELARPGS
jgi:F-type H+-transporting ATPase subunit epsilon